MNVLFILFASQMPQGLPQETNDATNSSAPGKKFAVNQEVIFVSENRSFQVLYIYGIDNFPFPCFF